MDTSPVGSGGAPRRPHAIALFSGGLDSALAVLLMLRQNVEVTALTFMTAFGCDLSDRSSCGHNPFPAAERFGFRVKLMNLGQDYVEMVQRPRFGRGKNMNPCVDCRIHMLRQAKDYMELVGADFLITGEVLGQRPFSQVRHKLALTEREADVSGLLVRPLSARLLPPTLPEIRGWIDRGKLMAFRGRTRKPQIELARELGLEEYPNPASGCLLTDPGYSARLRDLFNFQEFVGLGDLNLLRVGRQFRLSPSCKAIVGRDEADNARLAAAARDGEAMLEVLNAGSPITLLCGTAADLDLRHAAELTARYSDSKKDSRVTVTVTQSNKTMEIVVTPASDSLCRQLRIAANDSASLPDHGAE